MERLNGDICDRDKNRQRLYKTYRDHSFIGHFLYLLRLGLVHLRKILLIPMLAVLILAIIPHNVHADTVSATIPIANSFPIHEVFDPDNGNIYVSDNRINQIYVISGSTNQLVATIPLGGTSPDELAYDSTNKEVYVTSNNAPQLTAISTATNTVVGTVPANIPQGIVYDPLFNYIFATIPNPTNLVQVVRGGVNIDETFLTVPSPWHPVELIDAGGIIYLLTVTSFPFHGAIFEITDGTPPTLNPNPVVTGFSSLGGGVYDAAHQKLYVTDTSSTGQTTVDAIDNTNHVVAQIPVDSSNRITLNPTTGFLYTAATISNVVDKIDPTTNAVVQRIPVGTNPEDVVFDSRNSNIYSADLNSAQLSVISPISTTLTTPSSTGAGPVTFTTNLGGFTSLTAVSQSSLSPPPPPGSYPFGFFSWSVTGFAPATSVTITMTYPSPVPAGAQYLKLVAGSWVSVPVIISGNTMTVTITDNGPDDANSAAGTISDPGGLFVPPPTCSPGNYLDSSTNTCVPAPAGSYVPSSGATSAIPCSPGTFQPNTGQTSCTPAPAGSFVPSPGSTSSTLCPAGTFSANPGSSSCTPAPAGSFVGTTGATSATLCPLGTFSATAGQSACTPAPPGSFVGTTGATAPTPCPAGTFDATLGNTACTPAPPGSYVPTAGATSATPCPAGTYCPNLGTSTPLACPAGTTSNAGATSCTPIPPPSATGMNIATTEGISFSGTVAHFTDANPNAVASDFTATINWGDGTTSTATISGNAAGGFDITGTHTYSEEGSYHLSITIVDNDATTTTATSTATVTDAPLTATAKNINAVQGVALTNAVVTHFTDANPNAVASDFTATINWGDGTTSTATISGNAAGGFDVTGTHTYAVGGSYPLSITINDVGGATATATGTATVALPIIPTASPINAVEGTPFTGTVAHFTDANPNAVASDFTATINWGDGTTSTATISGNAAGGFDVTGTHTYAEEGSHSTSITINSIDGATATATGTATVADASLTATSTNINPLVASAFTGTVAHFTDANPNAVASDFTATINWGDGTTSTATISGNAAGGFDITGTHTYASAGAKSVSITINDGGGSSASTTLTATVKATTTTTVTSSANPSISGNAVKFTAAVTSATPGTITGTVTFYDGSAALGSGILDSLGHTSILVASLAVGPHSITASYGGDSSFNPSTSPVLVQTVQSPAQATNSLINTVNSMNLDHGIANSLDAKLNAAISSLNSGNNNAAKNQLNAFINEVNAQAGKKISQAQATQLIQAAQIIIGCPPGTIDIGGICVPTQ